MGSGDVIGYDDDVKEEENEDGGEFEAGEKGGAGGAGVVDD